MQLPILQCIDQIALKATHMPPKTALSLRGREWVSNVRQLIPLLSNSKDSSISLSLPLSLYALQDLFFFKKISTHESVISFLYYYFFRSYFITQRDVGVFATLCILIMQEAAQQQQQQQQIASFSSTCNCCFFSAKVCWLSDGVPHHP